uniref:methyl-accepting chemotaxis protein n=1 Tax=Agathobacter sp. TaxID=2021311 RepID=UPI004057A291
MKKQEKTFRKKSSIRLKIMVCMSLTVLIALAVSGIISSWMSYQSTVTLLEDTMGETASLAAERISYELKAYSNIAWEAGCVPRLSDDTVTLEEKKALIDQRIQTHAFQSGDVLDKNGYSIFDGTNHSSEEYFKQVMNGNTYISEPVIDAQARKATIVIAAPLWKDGVPNSTVIGVVYFIPDETFLNDIMVSIQVSENGSAYIINNKGTTIAHRNIDNIINQENTSKDAVSDPELAELAAMEQDAISGNAGFGIYTYGGVSKFLSYTSIPETNGWAIGINAPISDFLDATINSILVISVITVIALVISIMIAWILSASIGKPLTACANRLHTLTEGDLDSPMPDVRTNDEVGMLVRTAAVLQTNMRDIIADIAQMTREMSNGNFTVRSINRQAYQGGYSEILRAMDGLRINMSQVLGKISMAADQVDAGSDQVASNSQTLSESALEQTSAIQSLAESVNEINSYLHETDVITEDAKEKMKHTSEMTLKCNEQMKDMLISMNDISNASEEIGKIIKTIEDIAFQTNILALNASVEAARAGIAGKGFAVVADEVRSLAEKSAEASKSTTVLIDTSTNAVRLGVSLANETAEQLQSVADAAQSVDELVSNIAESAGKQALAIEQVTRNIEQISDVVQNNTATAQESAAASEELASQAAVLKEQINRFQLNSIA